MKRLIALALVLVLLTGCTPVANTTGSTAASTTASTTAPSQTPPSTTTPATTVPETTIPEPTNPETTVPEATEPPAPVGPACGGHDSDPYANVDVDAFYADYTTACCYEDAQYRSQHYLMSGSLEVPSSEITYAENRPMEGTAYIRNTDSFYLEDGNTYVVVDCYGQEAMRIYRGGAYITLEEVAAYMFAFGGTSTGFPANYSSNKKESPSLSKWGIYLRVNHSKFSGDTKKYPYEPELPNISGCGGSLQYYEMDIGTTGSGYGAGLYNNGHSINRGASRIVYGRCDLNGDGVYDQDEVFLFYTGNHYNDFQEYLNYYGGWGDIFGNQTGGGNGNPTPYVETAYASFRNLFRTAD